MTWELNMVGNGGQCDSEGTTNDDKSNFDEFTPSGDGHGQRGVWSRRQEDRS